MKRILIVDDAATIRLYYRTILEGAGFRVVEAMNGITAYAGSALLGDGSVLMILNLREVI
jgi:CheY-like chemotaxis protein